MTAGLMVAMIAVAMTAGTSAAKSGGHSKGGGRSNGAVPVKNKWKRFVIEPGRVAYPRGVAVYGAPGSVVNPQGLRAAGHGVTTITSSAAGSPHLVLDLGNNVGGYVEVGIRGSDGQEIRLGYSESLQYLTPSGDTCACAIGGLSGGYSDDPEARYDSIKVASPAFFRSPGIRGAERYINLQLMGPGTAAIDYVRVRPTYLHPGPKGYAGYFFSSDRLLNQIWYASAYTFGLDSFSDPRPGYSYSPTMVTDGAKRDRLIWAGDLGIENLVGNYSLRAGRRVTRDSLQAFSCLQYANGLIRPASQVPVVCPRTPPTPTDPPQPPQFPPQAGAGPVFDAIVLPEYTASWVIAVRDYLMMSGDRDMASRMMPVVRRALSFFTDRLDGGGLYRTPADTINWHPPDIASGVDSYTNAQLYRALIAGAELEQFVGGGAAAANTYTQRAATVRGAILARLWDGQAGAFLLNTDDPSRNHSQDAQVEAILGGVTSQDQAKSAINFMNSHLLSPFGVINGEFDADPFMSRYISPFISSTDLLARLSVRDTNGALMLMRRTWGQMLAQGPGTVWEKMNARGGVANYVPFQADTDSFSTLGPGGTSLAHGWAGGPVPALSGYVLGIRPTAPGYRRWIVAPQPGYLKFAQGRAPTHHGAISSRWVRGHGSFKLTVDAPKKTSGVVDLPVTKGSKKVSKDGHGIRRVGRGAHAAGFIRIKHVKGRQTFLVK